MKPNMIKQIENNLRMKIIKGLVAEMGEVITYVLYNKWGWGDVRLTRITDQINELFDDIESGYVSLDDVIQANSEIPVRKMRGSTNDKANTKDIGEQDNSFYTVRNRLDGNVH